MRRGRPAALALAVAVLLTGCAVTPIDPDPGPTGMPDGVTVALLQLRSDVASRQAQVEVHNGGDEPITIGDIAVTDPRFAGAAKRLIAKRSTIVPGGTVNIRIQLPEVSCDVPGGTSTVELTFIDGDSERVRTAPLPDRLDFVPPMHERECRAQALAEAASLRFASFEPSPPGVPAKLVLEVAKTGKGGAQIDAIQSTNLLTYPDSPATSFPIGLTLDPGDAGMAAVALPIVALRCDPHAVQEDKRGTVFNVEVELGGESGLVQVAADEDMRARILTWVGDWCRFGEN